MRLIIPSFFGCVLLCCCFCGAHPLTFDEKGIANGTGEKVYSYKSGMPKLREQYVDGKLVRSRWYKPDGTLVQETKWANGTGEGIYLRDNGSIRMRMQYVNGDAEGSAKEYDEAGNVTKIVEYRRGQPVREREPPASRPAK